MPALEIRGQRCGDATNPAMRALSGLSAVGAAQFLIDKVQKMSSNQAFLAGLVAPVPASAAARRFR